MCNISSTDHCQTESMELLKTVKQHKYIAYISFSVEFDQTFAKLWLDD